MKFPFSVNISRDGALIGGRIGNSLANDAAYAHAAAAAAGDRCPFGVDRRDGCALLNFLLFLIFGHQMAREDGATFDAREFLV